MKLSRYAVSGRIHRNGMAATSWVKCVVTASSSTDALADRPTHNRRRPQAGAAADSDSGASASAGAADERHAVHAQTAAKPTYAADQASACTRFVSDGSISTG